MNAGEVVRFSGLVQCRVDRHGPLGLTLIGPVGDATVHLSFVCTPPVDWPPRLEAPMVLREGTAQFRVVETGGDRALEASRVFVHRDAARVFDRAVPPRRAPLVKRVLWRGVLALAATSVGRRMLRR